MPNKHTPGPWSEGEYRAEEIMLPANCRRIYMPGNDAAWVTGTNKEANARLISAAPELLEALGQISNAEAATYDDIHAAIQDLVGIARAAIAKATGSAS